MTHCFQVHGESVRRSNRASSSQNCISGEECYGAMQIPAERSNPAKSKTVENLTSMLLQWQISEEYTTDSFDNEVGSKPKELLELCNVTAW